MKKLQLFTPQILLIVTAIAFALVFMFVKPIKQSTHYHHFANEFKFGGIENVANVFSNIGFVIVGALGVWLCIKEKQYNPFALSLVLGIFLTGFGSAYYHYTPNNITLVWDRIPMTIIFSSFFALIYALYFSAQKAQILWIMNGILGIFSVYYWQYTESLGQGDLRLYAILQFLPMILIFIILVLNHHLNKHLLKPLLSILIWYVIAKVFEHYDHQVYEFTQIISGHPLKHIAAAVATYYMLAFVRVKSSNLI